MTKHSLDSGQEVIDSLLLLGRSLGYLSEQEWRLRPGTAAIDVAWLRKPNDRVPLIAFEVETTASGGIAANALKVLGKDSERLRKPLHLFHVVVRGGLNSERPMDAAAGFAAHNYSIHLLEAEDEPLRLLQNILDVHSRVGDRVDGTLFASVLAGAPWPSSLLQDVIAYVQDLELGGLSERSFVLLSRENPPRFLPLLLERLQQVWHREIAEGKEPPNLYMEPPQPREEPYGSYMADAAGEALELGLIAASRPEIGSIAFGVLKRWQELNHIGDKVGPFSGAGTQWTQYEIENLGYMWGLIAALMFHVPGAVRWCAEQPAALLGELPETDAGEVLLLSAWVLHIAAAAGAKDIYETARARLERAGGISTTWLGQPEPGTPGEDGDWNIVFEGELAAPTAEELFHLVDRGGVEPGDPVMLALDALLEDPVMRPGDGSILAATLVAIGRSLVSTADDASSLG
ncbi:MAG TPA: hypothetical protein VF093_09680 [Solirubrobacterales bacterium]